MIEKTYVFAARIPFPAEREEVFPAARAAEIASCRNEGVRAGKYYVWKLLEYALREVCGLDIADVSFKREKSGKWRAEGVEFSLSHSCDVVAVALARFPVGVDVELCDAARFSRAFAEKILTAKEKEDLKGTGDAASYCNALWTKKEAVFKCAGGSVFRPEAVESSALPTQTVKIHIKAPYSPPAQGSADTHPEEYFLTVAAADLGEVCYRTPDMEAEIHRIS